MIFGAKPGEIEVGKNNSAQNNLGPDGLIYNVYCGDQTGLSVKKAAQELAKLFAQLRQKGKPVLIMTDITKIGEVNLSARKVGLEALRDLDYDRWAVIGCNFMTAGLVKVVITTSGRGFKVRIFENKKEARKWLLSK